MHSPKRNWSWGGCFTLIIAIALMWMPRNTLAASDKPNILFIMADDIGWMQVQAYAMGLTNGETPNIDRIGQEGMKFTNYYAMQSCTSGRTAFVTGMYPLRVGLIPPQLPGSPTALLPGTPDIAKVLLDLGYNTASSARITSATRATPCQRRTGFKSSSATCTIWTLWRE